MNSDGWATTLERAKARIDETAKAISGEPAETGVPPWLVIAGAAVLGYFLLRRFF